MTMPANQDTIAHAVTSQFLESLKAAPGNVQPEGLREVLIERLAATTPVSTRILRAALRVAEGSLLALAGLLLAIYHPGFGAHAPAAFYIPVILAVGLALPLLSEVFGLYSTSALLQPVGRLTRLLTAWALIFMALTAVAFASKSGEDYSRLWLTSWFVAGIPVLIMSRAAVARLMRHLNRNGQLSRHAVLIGGGEPAGQLIAALNNSPSSDVSIVGIFDDRDDHRSPRRVNDLPKLGTVNELVDFVRRSKIDLLLITLPLAAERRLLDILKRLWVLPVDIRLSAYTQRVHYRPRAYSYVGNVPFLDVFDRPLSDWGKIVKALEDRIIAALAIVLLSPLMLLVALAIKLDSKGPVLFKQKRYGFNNELIEVFKFRSMYHDLSDRDATKLVSKGDPRVTRIGRFLRKSSLDELPQFFNVLRGDLSLVGPRPHATKAKAADKLYNEVVDGYFARHRVKPGITGWAQINGWRGETDTTEKLERRVEHDLYYIENWSLLLDLYILWKTPFALLKTESAY
ncbi:MAG: undecaprenyl-phosphate glucose phosphotransferase [Hyphomicrobiales bacterium]